MGEECTIETCVCVVGDGGIERKLSERKETKCKKITLEQ